MRPQAPDLHLAPTVLESEAELTPTENPIAKWIRAAVAEEFSKQRAWMLAMEMRIIEAVGDVGSRLTRVELVQKAQDHKQAVLEARVDELERRARHTPTMPSPPPDGAE